MPTRLDRDAVKRRLDDGDLRGLFIEELGWDHGGADVEAEAAGGRFVLEAVAHKRGMVAYRYAADPDAAFPDIPPARRSRRPSPGPSASTSSCTPRPATARCTGSG